MLFEEYSSEVQFLLVYIREAHATDGDSPMPLGPLVEEPITLEERDALASTCVTELGLDKIPAVLDRIDNAVNTRYDAHPDRLYLVGLDGRVTYAGGRGPAGFSPSELELAIIEELSLIADKQSHAQSEAKKREVKK